MAESQAPYTYDASALADLRRALSSPRFDVYMAEAKGNAHYAMALYL